MFTQVKVIYRILLPILVVSTDRVPSCWEIWYPETYLLGQFLFKAWSGEGTLGGLINYTVSRKALGITARLLHYQPEIPGAK